MCLLICAALFGAFLYAARQRLLPVVVLRAWFTVNLLFSVVLSWALCGVAHFFSGKLKLYSKATAESLSRVACVISYGYTLRYNSQHVHVEFMEGSLPWSSITVQHDLCMCHTSFFDTLLYLWLVPYQYIWSAKTFAKASLVKLPLFGQVIKACGHFPVFFASEESASFSVNKEKQAAVSAKVETFLQNGGSLSFFPEGALNRAPEVLNDFRLGSFNTILQHKLPVYYMVTYGNHEVWNASLAGMPGYPADIYVYIGKYEYDAESVDARALATGVREEMQRHLDAMLALRKKRGYTPWYVAPPPKASKPAGDAAQPVSEKKAA